MLCSLRLKRDYTEVEATPLKNINSVTSSQNQGTNLIAFEHNNQSSSKLWT